MILDTAEATLQTRRSEFSDGGIQSSSVDFIGIWIVSFLNSFFTCFESLVFCRGNLSAVSGRKIESEAAGEIDEGKQVS